MNRKLSDQEATLCQQLVDQIGLILHGTGPAVQSATLADLLSKWLVGHPDFMRARLLSLHVDLALTLNGPNEAIAHGPKGHPGNEGVPVGVHELRRELRRRSVQMALDEMQKRN